MTLRQLLDSYPNFAINNVPSEIFKQWVRLMPDAFTDHDQDIGTMTLNSCPERQQWNLRFKFGHQCNSKSQPYNSYEQHFGQGFCVFDYQNIDPCLYDDELDVSDKINLLL